MLTYLKYNTNNMYFSSILSKYVQSKTRQENQFVLNENFIYFNRNYLWIRHISKYKYKFSQRIIDVCNTFERFKNDNSTYLLIYTYYINVFIGK